MGRAGKDVLEKLAMDDPGKLATIAYGLQVRVVALDLPTS
jgi:hypothetical protein